MPKQRVMSLDMRLDEWFPPPEYEDPMKVYPFRLRVFSFYDIGPRDSFFDHIRDMGRTAIDAIIDGGDLRPGRLFIVFPERWLGVWEQHEFLNRLVHHKDVQGLKEVDIITNGDVILTDVMPHVLRVVYTKKK